MRILPQTKVAYWALGMILAVPVFITIGGYLADTYYLGVNSGNSIMEDITLRPLLALSMLTGFASGITSFLLILISIFYRNERSILAFIVLILSFLFTLFLVAELVFPH